MLEIEKKQTMLWRIKPVASEDGNLIRESKPFRSDGKTREFVFLELFGQIIKDKEGDVVLGETAEVRVFKTLWEHTHKNSFNQIADAIESGAVDKDGFIIGIKLRGAHYKLPCDPYKLYNSDGELIVKANGEPAVGRNVTFFLLENEQTTLRQEYQNATKDLPYFGNDDDLEDEKDAEDKVDLPPHSEGTRRRR